jgi:ABC-type thiamine transport system ATPase subunit
MLVGEGENGKSTLIELVKKFLGPEKRARHDAIEEPFTNLLCR